MISVSSRCSLIELGRSTRTSLSAWAFSALKYSPPVVSATWVSVASSNCWKPRPPKYDPPHRGASPRNGRSPLIWSGLQTIGEGSVVPKPMV